MGLIRVALADEPVYRALHRSASALIPEEHVGCITTEHVGCGRDGGREARPVRCVATARCFGRPDVRWRAGAEPAPAPRGRSRDRATVPAHVSGRIMRVSRSSSESPRRRVNCAWPGHLRGRGSRQRVSSGRKVEGPRRHPSSRMRRAALRRLTPFLRSEGVAHHFGIPALTEAGSQEPERVDARRGVTGGRVCAGGVGLGRTLQGPLRCR